MPVIKLGKCAGTPCTPCSDGICFKLYSRVYPKAGPSGALGIGATYEFYVAFWIVPVYTTPQIEADWLTGELQFVSATVRYPSAENPNTFLALSLYTNHVLCLETDSETGSRGFSSPFMFAQVQDDSVTGSPLSGRPAAVTLTYSRGGTQTTVNLTPVTTVSSGAGCSTQIASESYRFNQPTFCYHWDYPVDSIRVLSVANASQCFLPSSSPALWYFDLPLPTLQHTYNVVSTGPTTANAVRTSALLQVANNTTSLDVGNPQKPKFNWTSTVMGAAYDMETTGTQFFGGMLIYGNTFFEKPKPRKVAGTDTLELTTVTEFIGSAGDRSVGRDPFTFDEVGLPLSVSNEIPTNAVPGCTSVIASLPGSQRWRMELGGSFDHHVVSNGVGNTMTATVTYTSKYFMIIFY